MSLPIVTVDINYDADKKTIKEFLENYVSKDTLASDLADMELDEHADIDHPHHRFTYMKQLQAIANREQQMLEIDLEDLSDYDDELAPALVRRIIHNTRRYVQLFSEIVDEIIPDPTKDISNDDEVLDIILHQRRERNEENTAEDLAGFPPQLLRRYDIFFKPLKSDEAIAVREVKGNQLGRLLTVRGIVTRISEVKPLLLVNAYTCDTCGSEIFQDIANKQFTPLTDCPSQSCQTDGVKGTLNMQTRACRFTRFQEAKIQEMADQVPVGHIPRTMTVHLYGGLTRQLNPGDVVHIGGIFLPTPYTGFQAIRAGLLTDTFLEAQHIIQQKKQYDQMEITEQIRDDIDALRADPDLYSRLANSIAPEIFGHEDVKKALLLLLVGGVTKEMKDGMRIRGDINMCLMGDPGVAKSQLLKYISKVAPRGVYTTGKGSSGVGLTAAVMRDPVTDEMVLEGGALVLADNGICCIDEFDKMEETDRTAIHEVMEQQTISISKAGISTTLNARTSILAAANPLYGRYNPKISPVENINLPAALLSRFDLMFLILDKPDRDADERLAKHVTYVHMYSKHPVLEYEPIDPVLMRHFIAMARQHRPTVPTQVSSYVVEAYVRLRKQHLDSERKSKHTLSHKTHTYTSARTLLGILRLAQALARLRFSHTVEHADVDEALRLMEKSKHTLDDDEDKDVEREDTSPVSRIFRIIKDMFAARRDRHSGRRTLGRRPGGGRRMQSDSETSDDDDEDEPELRVTDIRARIIQAGFTEDQLQNTLDEYENMDIWARMASGRKLRLINQ